MNIEIPIKKYPDDSYWLMLSMGLESKGLIFRAVRIDKDNKRPPDYDTHHCDQASATSSVKCRPKSYFIMDKIIKSESEEKTKKS
jgi:hypothetical protein